MAALQRNQLSKLCSSPETFETALSILRLANAKTRPGSGFIVKNPIAIPAVCAYLASEQLNANEVSLQSAMSASCVKQVEFSQILNTVRSALRNEEGSVVTNVTYETLVDTYHVQPRGDVIGCMEDAEAAIPRIDILKEKYGANVLSCAVFYWVCQLMDEPSVQERSLRHSYSIHPKTFKAVVTILDKQCDSVADQIRSYLLQKRSPAETSNPPQVNHAPKPIPTSPEKFPMKPAVRTQTRTRKMSTPVTTPTKKRTVAFSTRSVVRRRFRPIFLEQQQWYARDPKVERMWAAAEALQDEMMGLYGRPFSISRDVVTQI